MNFLEEKILADGSIKQGNILKVDNFLNHQIDIDIMRQIAYEFMMCLWYLPRKERLLTVPMTNTSLRLTLSLTRR